MGQWIQQGRRLIIETFVVIDGGEPKLPIPEGGNEDELGYLAGRDISEVNQSGVSSRVTGASRWRRAEPDGAFVGADGA